jgi:hypothetical protein
MNSLREICDFVGASGAKKYQASAAAVGALSPDPGMEWVGHFDPQATMRWIGKMVPVLTVTERTSMRAMIHRLPSLPPISLDIDTGSLQGEDPFTPQIHAHSSDGVILETTFDVFPVAVHGLFPKNSGSSAADTPSTTGPGSFTYVVTRVGIPGTGITTLTKSFNVIVTPKPAPPPPPPPPPPAPTISVQQSAKTDGGFVVSGTGFLGNHPVNILVGDGTLQQPVVFTVTSKPDGSFDGFQTGNLCQNRIDQFGQPSKRFFEASDGRISHGAQLFSNTVQLSCPA